MRMTPTTSPTIRPQNAPCQMEKTQTAITGQKAVKHQISYESDKKHRHGFGHLCQTHRIQQLKHHIAQSWSHVTWHFYICASHPSMTTYQNHSSEFMWWTFAMCCKICLRHWWTSRLTPSSPAITGALCISELGLQWHWMGSIKHNITSSTYDSNTFTLACCNTERKTSWATINIHRIGNQRAYCHFWEKKTVKKSKIKVKSTGKV